ncbi:MAG: hypothetical protein LZF86_100215 [Nitrospira sp.]|nr:MAG: hypothetical protein LZF86_100215 [Nitrospira sp.]
MEFGETGGEQESNYRRPELVDGGMYLIISSVNSAATSFKFGLKNI